PAFAEAGADWISGHQETCKHLHRTLELIKKQGCKAGAVINPATPVQTLGDVFQIIDFVLVMSVNPGFGGQKFIPGALDKLRKLTTICAAKGADYRIEIDGGIGKDTTPDAARAGAHVSAAGTARTSEDRPYQN